MLCAITPTGRGRRCRTMATRERIWRTLPSWKRRRKPRSPERGVELLAGETVKSLAVPILFSSALRTFFAMPGAFFFWKE
jgi:hypothetical protein